MKTFRTDVSVQPAINKITLKTGVLTVGSCFAEAMGLRLHRNKFKSLSNPYGVIYNPISIHKTLLLSVANEKPLEQTFLEHNGVHFNYDFHSQISDLDKHELTTNIANTIHAVHSFLKNASYIMITYGTSWVYQNKDSGEVVANCHKVSAENFTKRLLTEKEITNSFKVLFTALKRYNPDLKIILTLSPVRHIKDTFELNSVSKAVLRTACHTISSNFEDVEYFPAYEIMMDDLRDYRFYKSDMLHPTEEAEDYIWGKFSDCYFDDPTKLFLKTWKAITTSITHKPFHPLSSAHQQFLKETLKKLEELKDVINIEEEINTIKSQIIK